MSDEKKKPKKKKPKLTSSNPHANRLYGVSEHHRVMCGDCFDEMDKIAKGTVKLIYSEPDFYYGSKSDPDAKAKYLDRVKERLEKAVRLLTSDGTMFVVSNYETVSEIDVFCKTQLHLTKRDHIIWAVPFGTNVQKGYTKSSTHLLYYVRDPDPNRVTFHEEDLEVRIPSKRLEIGDDRAKAEGKLPDNLWMNPEELQEILGQGANVWHENRIAGTHEGRVEGAATQMPPYLMKRIILIHSSKGDMVLDMYGGTFVTALTAAQYERQSITIEIDPELCLSGRTRLAKLVDELSPK